MLSQPRSPNIFDAVQLTASKHASLKVQETAKSSFYFSKRLESITQFLDFLECNPDNHAELTELELRWERSFFKNQLKAALFLNYSLIKIHCQINEELKQLKFDTHNRLEKKKMSQEFENKLQWHIELSENVQDFSNAVSATKKKPARPAFEAEKKILNAKHQKECEELKRSLQKKSQKIRVCEEENQYIRGELLQISEKYFSLLNENRQSQDRKRKLEKENQELRTRLDKSEQLRNKQDHESKLHQLNCSPISRSNDTFGNQDCEISFNHDFLHDNVAQNRILRKQMEDIPSELKGVKQQNSQLLTKKHEQSDQHMNVMQQSCRLFLVELEKQYLDVKKQLQECIIDIQRYKGIIHEAEQKIGQNTISETEKHVLIQKASKVACSKCMILSKEYEVLKLEKKKIHEKYQALREKFDKTLNMELEQRQQWDLFLKDLKSSPAE